MVKLQVKTPSFHKTMVISTKPKVPNTEGKPKDELS